MNEKNQYLDIKQSFFVWGRPDGGYYWDDDATPDGIFSDSEANPPYLIETPETTGFVRSKIMELEPTLFAKFAALDEADNKADAIITFANAYGNLTGIGEHQVITPKYSHLNGEPAPWKHGGVGGYDKSDGRQYGMVGGESLSAWLKEIRDMALTLKIWEKLDDQNVEALRQVIYWGKDNEGVQYVLADKETLADLYANYLKSGELRLELTSKYGFGWLAFKDDHHSEIFDRFRPGDVILPARYLVQSRINEKLKEHTSKPRLLMNDENQLSPYLYPDDLLAAMWLQFFQAVTGERDLRRCAVCGLWAEMTNKNRNWTRHRECGNRERVYRSREKKKANIAQ